MLVVYLSFWAVAVNLNADEIQTGLAVGNQFVLMFWMLSLDQKFCCCCQLRQIGQLLILIYCDQQVCLNQLTTAIFVSQKLGC